MLRLDRPLLHFFKAALSSLNLAVILDALLVACTLELHTRGAAGSQEWCDSWPARDWAATAASLGPMKVAQALRGGREVAGSRGVAVKADLTQDLLG